MPDPRCTSLVSLDDESQDDTLEPQDDTDWEPRAAVVGRRERAVHLAQRGMVTAEYAVGILAAIALALALLHIFSGSQFAALLLKRVSILIGQIGATLK